MPEKTPLTHRLQLTGKPLASIEGTRAAGPARDTRTGREKRLEKRYGIARNSRPDRGVLVTSIEQPPDQPDSQLPKVPEQDSPLASSSAAPEQEPAGPAVQLPEVVHRRRSFAEMPGGLAALLPESLREKNS